MLNTRPLPEIPSAWAFLLARPFVLVVAVIFTLLAILVAFTALGAGFGWLLLPYELFVIKERLPVIFTIHMFASGTTLLLFPFVFVTIGNRLHKYLGRIAAALVLVGGLAALPVAFASVASPMAQVGFFMQGVTWIGFDVVAFIAIYRGETVRHGWLMLAMASIASGAIWLRFVMLALIYWHIPFVPGYSVAAWLCWLTPLALVLILWKKAAVAAPQT